jgi:hypothetical protein
MKTTHVTLREQYTGESWRYAVGWDEILRRFTVHALDEGWHVTIHPGDVPGMLTAYNVAVAAVEQFDERVGAG